MLAVLVTLWMCHFCVGCGYCGPAPADEATESDVVGRWVGRGCLIGEPRDTPSGWTQDFTTVELVLRADRSYSLRLMSDSGSVIDRKGGWWMRGAAISLSGWEWSGYATRYPVEGAGPSGFLLFGGLEDCQDPDSYELLRWASEQE